MLQILTVHPEEHQVAVSAMAVLASVDFTTIEVWTKSGLVTYYLLFVMKLATRHVHLAGCTSNPDESWIRRVARNLSDDERGFLRGKKFLLMDRDTKFSEAFRMILEQAGVKAVRLLARSPNLNPNLERYQQNGLEKGLAEYTLKNWSKLLKASMRLSASRTGDSHLSR